MLDELRFPHDARHLALEVFARSFFADPREFSGGELVAMFHAYFVGSSEGLLFDVPVDDYDSALWAPLAAHLRGLGVDVRTGESVTALQEADHDRLTVTTTGADLGAVDAVVLATDRAPLQALVAEAPWLGDADWRDRLAAQTRAPSFAVWRLWLDRPVAAGTPPFLGTCGHGPLDNVSVLEQFEAGAAAWSRAHGGGSVVELHAYAVTAGHHRGGAARAAALRAPRSAPRAGRRRRGRRAVAGAGRLPDGRHRPLGPAARRTHPGPAGRAGR